MPVQLIIILVLVAVCVLLIRVLAGGNQAQLALLIRRTIGGTCILISIFLLSRGLLTLAVPLFLIGLGVLGAAGSLGLNFPWGNKSRGQKSSVRTEMLAMELDHDSGGLDGEVLAGRFAGRRLAGLALEDLMALRVECLAKNDQSTALLDAYLDRVHPEWREQGGSEQTGNAASSDGGQMSASEAFSILGLVPGSTAAEIRKAHRRMMKRFHPDHGGSEYLARKINQARDILLSEN